MQVAFSQDKRYVLFLYENAAESNILKNFPGFQRLEHYYACPAQLSVAYNLVSRISNQIHNTKVAPDVQAWIDQPLALAKLPETFKYHTLPKDFQDIALRYLYTLGSAGILLDPGMGKSKVVLDYIVLKGFNRSLVVCPAALLFVWEDEIAKHRPDLSCYVVKTTDWEVEKVEILKHQVVVINYNKLVILKHRIKELKIDFMHLDEFLIKDPKTSRSQSALEIARGIPYRCGGSGTLVNNSPLDVFNPIRYLQPSLVGWNYMNFMGKYAIMKEARPRPGSVGKSRQVVVAFRGKEEIRSILESCCIVMTKEVWLKLPPKHFHDIHIDMSTEQEEAYNNLSRNYYASIQGRDVYIDSPLVMLSKLNQISQGFIYVPKEEPENVYKELLDEETTETKTKKKAKPVDWVFFREQPKIVALKKLLTETLKDKKCIIWFNLNAEYELIKKLLDELGESYLTVRGGEKKTGEKVRTFNKTPSILRLVCQAKSVNYGITVLGSKKKDLEDEGIEVLPDVDPSVCNQVFYSINFSLEVYLQQQDRIHRLGQEFDCHYYRIFVFNPLELKLRKAIEDKIFLKEEMLIDFATELMQGDSISEL